MGELLDDHKRCYRADWHAYLFAMFGESETRPLHLAFEFRAPSTSSGRWIGYPGAGPIRGGTEQARQPKC